MLFIAERAAGLTAIPSEELPPLCAIANVLNNAKAIASLIVETFIVSSSLVREPHVRKSSAQRCSMRYALG
jgi:hypothetical protein